MYSEAEYNHKAILIDEKKNIIAFQGDDEYFIYSYDRDLAETTGNGFKLEAEFETEEYGNSWGRGLYIEDYIYKSL